MSFELPSQPKKEDRLSAELSQAQQEQDIPHQERINDFKRELGHAMETNAQVSDMYQGLFREKKDQERFFNLFLGNVFEYLSHSTTGTLALSDFQVWYCFPESVRQESQSPLSEEAFQGRDVPYVEHVFVQAQIIFLKVVEKYLKNGLLHAPKKLIGGVVDLQAYRLHLEEILPPVLEEASSLQKQYKERGGNIMRVFDYTLRHEMAIKNGFDYVSCFTGYGGLIEEEDLAIAKRYNRKVGGCESYLIRRDGTVHLPSKDGPPSPVGNSQIKTDPAPRSFIEGIARRREIGPRGYEQEFYVLEDGRKLPMPDKVEAEGEFMAGTARVLDRRSIPYAYNFLNLNGECLLPIGFDRANLLPDRQTTRREFHRDGYDVIRHPRFPFAKKEYPAECNIFTPDGTLLLQEPQTGMIEIHPGYFILLSSPLSSQPISGRVLRLNGTEAVSQREIIAHGSGVVLSRGEADSNADGARVLEAALVLNGETYPFNATFHPSQLQEYPNPSLIKDGVIELTHSMEIGILDMVAGDGGAPRLLPPVYYTIFGEALFQSPGPR